MCKKILTILRSKTVHLDYDLYSMQIWYTSVHFKLVDLKTLQVIVKSYWQHTSLDESMKSSQPEFHANASLSSQISCRKHNIYAY